MPISEARAALALRKPSTLFYAGSALPTRAVRPSLWRAIAAAIAAAMGVR